MTAAFLWDETFSFVFEKSIRRKVLMSGLSSVCSSQTCWKVNQLDCCMRSNKPTKSCGHAAFQVKGYFIRGFLPRRDQKKPQGTITLHNYFLSRHLSKQNKKGPTWRKKWMDDDALRRNVSRTISHVLREPRLMLPSLLLLLLLTTGPRTTSMSVWQLWERDVGLV